MKTNEHAEQVAFFQWFRVAYPNVLAFAIPNGGHRHIQVAKKLKDEGVVAGIPDIMIADGKPGCFIEMKVKPNKVTDTQQNIITTLSGCGYQTAVCYGWDEAREVAQAYLNKSQSQRFIEKSLDEIVAPLQTLDVVFKHIPVKSSKG